MSNPKYIQPYGDQLMLMMDDGSQYLAYRTQTMWVINTSGGSGPGPGPGPDPEPGKGSFSWPFSPSTMTSQYGPRTGPIGSFHEGMDFGYSPAVYGAKEFASNKGTVEAVNLNSNYGYSVQLYHGTDAAGNGLHTIYAHMNANPLVHVGQVVDKGTLLGYLGASGDAIGAHLHWETHTCPHNGPIVHNTSNTSSGLSIRTAIDPKSFMKTYGDGAVFPQ